MKKRCRSCRREFDAELPTEDCRCTACRVTFEAWLRGDSPVVYQPRRDGVWRDVSRPVR
jgi:hypothetical protein